MVERNKAIDNIYQVPKHCSALNVGQYDGHLVVQLG